MTIKLHNTLTGKLDDFVSQQPGKVSIYTCGPTVYDYPHIGNWAAYVYWDILVRILAANDYKVTRVMNLTDVGHLVSDGDDGEDKLEKGAKREGKTAWQIADMYSNIFLDGMKRLNLITPDYITKATEYIPEQIALIEKLKARGVTYKIDDGIYFDTSKFPRYADFAHLNLDALREGARVEANKQKRNPSDFALWKFSPANEKRAMEWEYEGVMGFPGWHLECSAMAMSILGNTLDIHTGGIDHIPVHHTNEIAQSETVTGLPFSNYWLHCNFIKVDGTKFSKSLNNGYTLDDVEKNGYSLNDFRMFLLQGNYRNESNFTFDNLAAARNRLHNWRNVAAIRHQIHDTIIDDNQKDKSDKSVALYATSQAIIEAVSNDLNTPEALKIIDEAFSIINNSRLENIHRQSFVQLIETIDTVLGLDLIKTTPDISDDLKHTILERVSIRNQKNWKESDKLRDELLKQGMVVKDLNNETIWEYKD